MNCDHGVSLDRYCGSCEWDLHASLVEDALKVVEIHKKPEPQSREWSRWGVVVAVAAMCLIVAYHLARGR